MKTKIKLIIAAAFTLVLASCGTDFKKTKSGLVYKIISGGGKDSVVKVGNVVKFHFIRKVNDSVIYTSYDKMPGFAPLTDSASLTYSPLEIMFMMKKGDSAVTVEVFDTLIKKGMQEQMPFAKKGDRITTYLKLVEVFRKDSLARIDYNAEMERDKPRQEKEMKEMQAKRAQEEKEAEEKEMAELKKSGMLDKQQKEVEDYLAAKKITALKTEAGAHVLIKQKGTGEPVVKGKFITVKYTGRSIVDDKVFESSSLVFQIGVQPFIRGWVDGLYQFNKGGSGLIVMPGYLAYGKKPGPNGKEYEGLAFDVEVLGVSDNQNEAYDVKRVADSIDAAKPVKK